MNPRWMVEEKRTEGEGRRDWEPTTVIHVDNDTDALTWFAGYLEDTAPGWSARLVRVEEVRTVLYTEEAAH